MGKWQNIVGAYCEDTHTQNHSHNSNICQLYCIIRKSQAVSSGVSNLCCWDWDTQESSMCDLKTFTASKYEVQSIQLACAGLWFMPSTTKIDKLLKYN